MVEVSGKTLDPPLRPFAHDVPVRTALFELSQWWNKTSTGGSNSSPKPDSLGIGLFPRAIHPRPANSLFVRSTNNETTPSRRVRDARRDAPRLSLSLFACQRSRVLATEAIALWTATTSGNKGERLTVQDEPIVLSAARRTAAAPCTSMLFDSSTVECLFYFASCSSCSSNRLRSSYGPPHSVPKHPCSWTKSEIKDFFLLIICYASTGCFISNKLQRLFSWIILNKSPK